MDEQAVEAMSEGEDSLDSIPRPEYEAIGKGITSRQSSPIAVTAEKEGVNGSVVESISDMLSTEDASSEKAAQDFDLDTSDEKLNEDTVYHVENQYKNNKCTTESLKVSEPHNQLPTQSAGSKINETAIATLSGEAIVKRSVVELPHGTISNNKLVQAKTKDNKYLLVQLVDENGKTQKPPVRNINKADITAVSTARSAPILSSSSSDGTASTLQQNRSSTPISREFLALQKSVNESKILTEFVTDIAVEKARKRKTATPLKENSTKSDKQTSLDAQNTIKVRRKSNTSEKLNTSVESDSLLEEMGEKIKLENASEPKGGFKGRQTAEEPKTSASPLIISGATMQKTSTEKPRKNFTSKFVPLKDDSSSYQSNGGNNNNTNKRRSRSKSVSRKSPMVTDSESNPGKLKRWPSEEKSLKRTNMRSQNSDFVQKQMDFLQRVTQQEDENNADEDGDDDDDDGASCLEEQQVNTTADGDDGDSQYVTGIENLINDNSTFLGNFAANASDHSSQALATHDGLTKSLEKHLESIYVSPPKRGWDSFCWKCRQGADLLACSKCVRSFHATCIKITAATKLDKTWSCPECVAVENVVNGPKKLRRNDISLELLSQLLSFALKRMRNVKGLSQFLQSMKQLGNFPKYFVNLVTFETLEEKIEKKVFRCAEEFVNETKWMQHNALIAAAGTNNKDTITAKAIFKICRQEANEIDTCPECYLNANTRNDWFVDVCSQPHLLLWAKLKGFPYWPAKAMGLGQGAHVNVRFFGQHDRAFVPIKDCYLFSEQVPNALTGKRSSRAGFAECIQEVEVHIEKIKAKIGAFIYAPYKTLYDPTLELQQLEQLMPGVQEFMKRQQSVVAQKPSLQYKIVKTADNHLSIVKKGTTAVDSGTESDHSLGTVIGAAVINPTTNSTPTPKKKSPDCSAETTAEHSNKISKLATASNYEVIHKIDNDEGNIPKVSAVILKRKAETSEHRKNGDGGADNEMPLPKMTKIEDNIEEEAQPPDITEKNKTNKESATTTTEKISAIISSQTVTPKPTATEPKVPILTIKTNVNKVVENKRPTEAAQREEAGKEDAKLKEVTTVQNTVENLVKNKQGVTIKKLTKEDVRKKQQVAEEHHPKEREPVVAVATTTKQSVVENSETVKSVSTESLQKDQSVLSKPPTSSQPLQTVRLPPAPPPTVPLVVVPKEQPPIIKNLIPFVEIKKEIPSDDEQNEAENAKETAPVIAPAAIPNPIESVSTTAQPLTKLTLMTANITETNNTSIQAPMVEVSNNLVVPLIETVKKEVLTDDEIVASPRANETAQQSQTSTEKTAETVSAAVSGTQLSAPSESVRVVGDTTIQRISTKAISSSTNPNQTQAQALQFQAPVTNGVASMPLTGVIYTGLSSQASPANMSNAAKRNSLRGIPYGPLPASATTTPRTTPHNFDLEKQQQPPPNQKVRQDVQRARKSFPNRSPNEVSPIRSGDTTPPIVGATPGIINVLDPKRTLAKTSMVSIPFDATSRCNSAGVIPVPPLTAVSKGIPTTTASSNALTTATSTVPASSSTVATFLSCNGSTQVSMSAPPPLAGLSYSTLSSTPSTATLTTTSTAHQLANGTTLDSSTGSIAHSSNISSHAPSDFISPTFAAAITDAICRGPPRMTPRPNGPLHSDGSTVFPSQAGPVCRTLAENAHKLTDFFISVMEDTMCEMSVSEEPVLQAKITLLSMELERTKQNYENEIAELKRTSDLLISEMRKSMEAEKVRIAADVRKQCELERKRSVEETKKKQWCANCGRESQFHCCWNTSYCDYPCQQLHWSRHAASCAQTRTCNSNETSSQSVGCVNTSAQMVEQRNHVSNSKPPFTTIGANMPTHYNNKPGINNKKDKPITKVNTNNNNIANTTLNSTLAPTEVLKLPNNTYLRPVTSSTSVRPPFPPTAPVQRFNIPLPIAAPANPGLPYTLVQREGNWELMSTLTPTVTSTNTSNNSLTINTSQHQHNRMATTSALMSGKNAPRSRVNTATVSMQAHSSNMTGSLHGGGGGPLRSTQM